MSTEVEPPAGASEPLRQLWQSMRAEFDGCCDLLALSSAGQQEVASRALADLVFNADAVDEDLLLSPGFSRHGYDHARHLAMTLRGLLAESIIDLSALSERERIDALLLSFGAFIYHDIGMMIAPSGLAKTNVGSGGQKLMTI